jgi:hypothetical protein
MPDLLPQPDPRKTLMRALGVLVMLAIAISGMCYSAYVLWTKKF